ncbi:hypothetical protein EG327_010597 [Venturia inaequalis]|uniref:Uncharacterized protein n=1 Tax=Venturia inaequalis TaxID=5025 RepID=A0A8H3VMH4_VENIN|nr:hypothetical protein EG327_010597 [Venturia inaequalis]
MQSESAYMSFEWARRNESCCRLQGVQLSASLSSSKSGRTETLNQTGLKTSNTCRADFSAPIGTSNSDSLTFRDTAAHPTTTLLDLPCEIRLRIIEYIVHAEGLPVIRYQKSTRSDLTRQHALNKTCQKLCHEFNQIQREKAIHVVHHVFGCGATDPTYQKYPDSTFGNLDHIRHVKVVAEFSTSFQQMNAIGESTIDIITSEFTRFSRAKNLCVELRMSVSSLPFYGNHAPNTHATELILILGVKSHLPSIFLPGPAPMEDWLADIIKQFPNVKKVSLTWEGAWFQEGYLRGVEEGLLKDSLEKMCKEGMEIGTVVHQLR